MHANFNPARDIPDLSGKVIVVTGGNAGIGAETVRRLAGHSPKCIYLCARTPSKAEATIASVREQHPKANIKAVMLDLVSLESTRAAANQIIDDTDRLDILILNAGIAATPPSMQSVFFHAMSIANASAALTKDGYEEQFGVNHMGHASFTQALMPLLLKTSREPNSDVRITAVASAAHQFWSAKTLALDKVRTPMSEYASQSRYGHSKLANILFARKLAKQYPSITVTSLHPGVVKTDLPGRMVVAFPLSLIIKPIMWLTGITVEEGAKTQLWASTSKAVRSGEYYEPVGKVTKTTKLASDEKALEDLWSFTEQELRLQGGSWPAAA